LADKSIGEYAFNKEISLMVKFVVLIWIGVIAVVVGAPLVSAFFRG
jgi:hypothetical protein